ncbi:MAG: amidohydrolase family protein [Variovorax sp.]
MTVVIEEGKIRQIVAGSPANMEARGETVDGRGKFVIPGYLDMHSHPLNLPDPSGYLKLMLASGITGYRQMSGSPQLLKARAEGRLAYPVGPELLAISGTIMTDALTPTPEAAAAEVRKQKAEGADFIKTVGLTRANFYGAMNEAKALGIPFDGHIQSDVDVRDVAKGMRAIEHLGPGEAMLLGCSSDEAAIRKSVAKLAVAPPQVGPGAADMEDMIARIIASPMASLPDAQLAIIARVIATYDETKCKELVAEFLTDGTWQVPTLIRLRTMAIPDDPAYKNDPNLRFIPAETRRMWDELAEEFPKRVSAVNRQTLRELFDLQLKLTRLLADSGVPMMAGTDAGGSQWVVPGYSIHQEFDLFAEAGLTPIQILQIATINGAKFLGREDTMGTVEVGKSANLVLLDANPLVDVSNMHRVIGVVRDGIYYASSDLEKLRDSALP